MEAPEPSPGDPPPRPGGAGTPALDATPSPGVTASPSERSAAPASSRPAWLRDGPDSLPTISATGHLVALLLSDLLPLLGVLVFRWQVFPVILLFWCENVVAGVFTVLKMRRAEGSGSVSGVWHSVRLNGTSISEVQGDRGALVRLFVFNYGIFTAMHGFFLLLLFGGGSLRQAAEGGRPWGVAALWFGVALVSLVLTYLREYLHDFLAGGEYTRLSPQEVMTAPYGRMIVMHVTIIAAGWFLNIFGAPLAGLVLLVVLKTGFDLATWRKGRQARRSASAPPDLMP